MEEKVKIPRKIVRCPHCGYEYLAGEIFYPDSVFGRPKQIIRDTLGHIIYEDYEEGSEPSDTEKFYCENCDRPFIAEWDVVVRSKPEEQALDFSELSTKLF